MQVRHQSELANIYFLFFIFFIHNLDEIKFIQVERFSSIIWMYDFSSKVSSHYCYFNLFFIQKLDEKFSPFYDFQQIRASTYRFGFLRFFHHWIHLGKLYAIVGPQSLLEIVLLGVQRLFFYFWDLFHIKSQKLISPA